MRRRSVIVVAAFGVALLIDLAVGASFPLLTAALGFGGCTVLVLASKWLGKALLKRPEVYYEDPVVVEDLGDAA